MNNKSVAALFSTFSTLAASVLLPLTVSVAATSGLSAGNSGTSRSATFPEMKPVYQEGLRPRVEASVGLLSPEGSYSSGAEWGVGFGFQPYVPFGVTLIVTSSKNPSMYSGTLDLERTTVLVRGSYHFAGELPVIKYGYAGVAAGPVIERNIAYLGFAPSLGFDIPVREWSGEYLSTLSFGLDARYLMVSSNESDGLTVSGSMKYWF